MSSDWVREHKETNATKEGAPMGGVCVAFRAKQGGLVSLMLLGGFQCLRTGFVSTMRKCDQGRCADEGCLCCLQGERKRCRFVNVTGRFPMSLNWIREHKETNATKEGAPKGGVCVAFRAKEGGLVSLMKLGGFQCLWIG
jgi:hypothetical protein